MAGQSRAAGLEQLIGAADGQPLAPVVASPNKGSGPQAPLHDLAIGPQLPSGR
jgi:hypothetical protein